MEEKENQIRIIKRIAESDGSHSWQIINVKDYIVNPKKPMLIVFGGNGTNGEKATKGNANVVDSLIGVFNEDVELLSIDYNGSQCFTEDISPLLKSLILPLISKDGARLPIDEALKNMRQVTIFAHCFGALIPLEELLWQTTFAISDLGYSEEEEAEIMKQIVSVSFATKRPTPFISGLDVLSLTDDTFDKERIDLSKKFLKNLSAVKLNPADAPFLRNQPTEYFVPQNVIDFIEQNDRCYVLPNDNKKRLALVAAGFSEHGDHALTGIRLTPMWRAYPSTTQTGYTIAKCVAAVLCNSIANSLLNTQNKKHIPFSIEFLQSQLEDIVQKTNESNANYDVFF